MCFHFLYIIRLFDATLWHMGQAHFRGGLSFPVPKGIYTKSGEGPGDGPFARTSWD